MRRLVGPTGETVSQLALSVTDQLTLEVTATLALPAPAARESDVGVTVRLFEGGANTVAGTAVCEMPLAPLMSVLPQVVSDVVKFVTMSSCVQHDPLPDQNQPR